MSVKNLSDSELLKKSIELLKNTGCAFIHLFYVDELLERGFIENQKPIHIKSLELRLERL